MKVLLHARREDVVEEINLARGIAALVSGRVSNRARGSVPLSYSSEEITLSTGRAENDLVREGNALSTDRIRELQNKWSAQQLDEGDLAGARAVAVSRARRSDGFAAGVARTGR